MGNRYSLLIVEDSEPDRMIYERVLGTEYKLRFAVNADSLVQMAKEVAADLVLLDVTLPRVDGFEACTQLKESESTRHIPVMFVTAKSGALNRISGLKLGAEDYLEKPLHPAELKLRIDRILHRAQRNSAKADDAARVLRSGPFIVDLFTNQVSMEGGSDVPRLSSLEFRLLLYFLRAPDRILKRQELLDRVWGVDAHVTERVVDTCVGELRKKIAPFSHVIHTVRGEGYRYDPKTAAAKRSA